MLIKQLLKRDSDRKALSLKFLEEADEYAYGHYGQFDWHRNLFNIDEINFNYPFLRSIEGKDHTLFVIDIDIFNIKDIQKKLKFATVVVKLILDKYPDKKWLIKYSGSSFHLIQKYNKRINPNAFLDVLKEIFKEWTIEAENELLMRYFTKTFECDGETFTAGIDISLTDKRHLITSVYSEYPKEPGIYSRVVKEEELDDYQKIIENSKLMSMDIIDYEIPEFSFTEFLGKDIEIDSQEVTRNKIKNNIIQVKSRGKIVPVTLIPQTKENQEHLENMIKLIEESQWECIKKAVHRSKNERGIFFERAPIARFLWWNYKKDLNLIAYYFYYAINDENDNQPKNWLRMVKGINYAIYNTKGEEKSLDTWHSENIIRNKLCDPNCSQPCKKFITDSSKLQPSTNFNSVITAVSKVIKSKKNTILKKTTRVGVTSSVVLSALTHNKKILVICPTNAIGEETFYNISLLAHNHGMHFSGAVLGSNVKLCLKCMKEIEKIKEKFNTIGYIAIEKLPFILKEKCIDNKAKKRCQYFNDTYPDGVVNENGIRTPVINSQINPPYCAFATIFKNINNYNVIFLTYDKIRVLINQLQNNLNLNETEEIINSLLNNFDIILLDEISRFINTPSTELTILTQKKKLNENYEETDEIETTKNILNEIRELPGSEREMWNSLLHIKGKEPNRNIVNIVLTHIDHIFSDLLSKYKQNTWGKIANPIPTHIREEIRIKFNEWYSLFVEYAKIYNYYFKNILNIMELVSQDAEDWYIINIPKSREIFNLQIKISPFYDNVIDFVKVNFNRGKQIIVTDATMPYVDVSELFGIEFNEIDIGDPRDTCKLQLIIPDSVGISNESLIKKTESNSIRNRLINFISDVCLTFGSENVMIVAQNKDIYYLLINLYSKKLLPETININRTSKQVTYYRSGATIGVANERRIMVTIGNPFPPANSYIWMAEMLKAKGLFKNISQEELSKRLLLRETSSAFFQTIGRCKDPFTEDPSIVFCFGMKTYTIKKLINDLDVQKPFVININRRPIELSLSIGKIWKTQKIFTEESIYELLDEIKNINSDEIKISELPERLKKLSYSLYKIPQKMLDFYQLSFDKKTSTIKKLVKN